jgi:hypothetical protein
MVRKAVEANRAGTTAIGAIDVYIQSPLSRAPRPFVGPVLKVGMGRFDQFTKRMVIADREGGGRGPERECVLSAPITGSWT